MHAFESTDGDVAGVVICPCGAYVLTDVARATGGACVPCFREGLAGRTQRIEVRALSSVINLPSRPAPTPARRARERAKQQRRAKNPQHAVAAAARKAALRRLRDIFRPAYEMLLADERAERGLEPFTIPALINHADGSEAAKTLEWAAVYSALEGSSHADAEDDNSPSDS